MNLDLCENLPLIANAPDGIKKLRGLILELAVRGKLVSQDPSDEPATELLKRNVEERARLEAEGLCKKSKQRPPDAKDKQLFELPASWCWCRLPDVADYRIGKTPPTKEAMYWSDNGTAWVSISDMVYGESVLATSRTVSKAAREKIFKAPPVPAGTLLMSFKLTVGKVATLGIDAFHNEAIISIFPFSGVSQEYLAHFLPMISKGGNSKNALMGYTLNSESLSLLSIPLPPLAEQHRIVAKVDELMALCDRLEAEQNQSSTAHTQLVETLLATLTQSTDASDFEGNWQRIAAHFDTLFTTEASVEALEQTILQLAVMGKLTPQDTNDEPASELLKRIDKANLRSPLKCNAIQMDQFPPIDDNNQPFKLPSGWEWAQIGSVTEIRGGKRLPAGRAYSSIKTDHVYIQVTNMKNGTIVLDNLKYIDDSTHSEIARYTISADDLYVTIAGTIGEVGGVPTELDGMNLTENAAKISFTEFNLNALRTILSAPYVKRQFLEKANQQAQPKLALKSIASTIIAIPPLSEQQRIVAKVDELMAICSQLKERLIESKVQESRLADTLIQSALSITA